MRRNIDFSGELYLCRYLDGVTLCSSESLNHKKFSIFPLARMGEVMQFPFNVYFHQKPTEICEANELCWRTLGFNSKSDALGSSIAKMVKDKSQVQKVISNDEKVIATQQLHVFDESAEIINKGKIHGISFKLPWYIDEKYYGGVFGCSVIFSESQIGHAVTHITFLTNLLFSAHHIKLNTALFSPREFGVAQHLVSGRTMREIAHMLDLSPRTIESYIETMKAKAGVKTRSQLVQFLLSPVP